MVQVADRGVELTSAPIPRDWVLEGEPRARNALLSRSADRTACTLLWDCTVGRFVWTYDQDETIHLLEGDVTLTFADGRSLRIAAGEIVFFPAGAKVEWQVHAYVRKLAMFRETVPAPLAILVRVKAKARAFAQAAAARARRGRSAMPGRAGAFRPGAPQPA